LEKLDYVAELGAYEPQVQKGIQSLQDKGIMERIWTHDYGVWKDAPDEISNRLGWLHTPEAMLEQLPRLRKFTQGARNEGFGQALLLGMGGSSLAPQVFRNVFGVKDGFLDLNVLDSTDPAAVLAAAAGHDPHKTLYIVSTKSGGTVETFSFFKYFYNQATNVLGKDDAGKHFVAITDPGSSLVDVAKTCNFRDVFLNDPNIGGRYSALSFFGLVPAALLGVDLEKLLDGALKMVCKGKPCHFAVAGNRLGAQSGSAIGVLAQQGRDKMTLAGSERMNLIGPWVEQLIAESLGKEGKGVLPVSGERLGPPGVYGEDRFFVCLHLKGEPPNEAPIKALKAAGHPLAHVYLSDINDLGAELFRWEMATAVAGHFLKINPFDQPNVEAAKALAHKMVKAYHDEGALPALTPSFSENGITVYADVKGRDLTTTASHFFGQANAGDYVSLQAYVPPTDSVMEALQAWRMALRDRCKLATTLGVGPRFLHSTGQLHKGDRGNGLFVQITCDDETDVAIPDEVGSPASSMSFGVLKAAQALGDRQALLDAKRRVIRFHLGTDVVKGIQTLRGLFG